MKLREPFRKLLRGSVDLEDVDEVLATGHTKKEITETVQELGEEKTELESELQFLKTRLNGLIEEADRKHDNQEELREIRRLRNKAENRKERIEDIHVELEAWEEILGTHDFEQIVEGDRESIVDLSDVNKAELKDRMQEVAKNRAKRRKQANEIKGHAKSVRGSAKSLDLSKEEEAVRKASRPSSERTREQGERSWSEIEEEVQRLEKESHE